MNISSAITKQYLMYSMICSNIPLDSNDSNISEAYDDDNQAFCLEKQKLLSSYQFEEVNKIG